VRSIHSQNYLKRSDHVLLNYWDVGVSDVSDEVEKKPYIPPKIEEWKSLGSIMDGAGIDGASLM